MKNRKNYAGLVISILSTMLVLLHAPDLAAQCNANFIYGLTNVGMIQRINTSNGNVAAALNPAYTGNAPSLSNALGYNELNGKYYYFKRNAPSPPQEFVSFDPSTNLYSILAPSPVASSNIVNLGCLNSTGLGYYCIDAYGTLYYYSVGANTWTTICSNIKDQFGATVSSIIGPGSLNRIYGDMAFDGAGNLWVLVSGASDYGLYKISGPLPTTAVANLTAKQVIAPTTASPAGTFGGMAFSSTGTLYIASNSPSNKLYLLSTVTTLTYITTLAVDGIGNDLTSCNFPLSVLAVNGVKLSASLSNGNTATLNWDVLDASSNTGYEVEYSTDGASWSGIHFTYKTDNELSTTYTFSQSNLPAGTAYYRIRSTDQEGAVTYSNTAALTVASHSSIRVWPNPVQAALRIQTTGAAHAFICDNTGRMLSGVSLISGINTMPVNNLLPGSYIVNVKLTNGEMLSEKFVKQ